MEGYSLKKFFQSPLPMKYLPYLFLVFSLLGFFDLSFLTIQHYKGVIPPCTLHGCDIVLTSQYSAVAGIPIALIGACYYLINLVGMVLFIQIKNKKLLSGLFSLNVAGLFVAAVLVYLQAFVIHAFCQYCLFGELMIFLIFDSLWWMYNNSSKT